MSFYRMSL
uniref:Uncharacterized protein n=1 Tax=Arundo donax TaxID=35708 RepID=A0A0A9C925_ARUDO